MVNPVNLKVGDFVRFKPSPEHQQYREAYGAPEMVQVYGLQLMTFLWLRDRDPIACSYNRVKRAEGPW